MTPIYLPRVIRDLRFAKGWGPDELASRARISRGALYQIERGSTSKPQAGTLQRISRALGVTVEELLGTKTVSNDGILPVPTTMVRELSSRVSSSERADELIVKFRMLLSSPLADGVALIVEESYRLLPIIPPTSSADRPRRDR
jgi:transcriptional regulator with XRE-family HTH domain